MYPDLMGQSGIFLRGGNGRDMGHSLTPSTLCMLSETHTLHIYDEYCILHCCVVMSFIWKLSILEGWREETYESQEVKQFTNPRKLLKLTRFTRPIKVV